MQNSQALISYKLFSYFEALEPTTEEILGPLDMMSLHDLKAGVKGQIWHMQEIFRPQFPITFCIPSPRDQW